MVKKIGPEDVDVILKWGGGLHTRASEDEIDLREAKDGANFLLDLENRELRNRPPFDLIGTLPNAGRVNGGGSLLKSDGTVSTLFQGGGIVYEWDGASGFTSVGTVSSNARLRGHWRTQNWVLGDLLIITDLALVETVAEWDGTTFQSTTFTDEADAAFGTFYAKYCLVNNERAIYFNTKDPGATAPHLIVGSASETYTQITITNKPSSGLAVTDPYYLLSPDLKPINGVAGAFGTTVISTEKGMLFKLTGADATDFAFADFYPGSSASGNESLAYIGNDIIYGRQGRIESVSDTDRFGDTEADDLTRFIADTVQAYTGWTSVYNSRLNRAYLFPSGQSEVWVLNVAMLGGQLSPWMKWTTSHVLDFQPTFVDSMLDPSDGLEYVFMGDASGNIYRMEGTGTAGDGGSASVAVDLTSKLFSAKLDANVFHIEGYLRYRAANAATVTITLRFAGRTAFDESVTITIPALSGGSHWGGASYWGGAYYWGVPFKSRLLRQPFVMPGQSNEFQIRVQVSGTSDFQFNEIGLRCVQASS